MKFRTMYTAEMPEPYIGKKSIYKTYQQLPPYATDPLRELQEKAYEPRI